MLRLVVVGGGGGRVGPSWAEFKLIFREKSPIDKNGKGESWEKHKKKKFDEKVVATHH